MRISSEKIKNISELLKKETYLYSKLLNIAMEIQQDIVKNDVTKFSLLVESEDEIFSQAEKLRQDRMELMMVIKQDLNLSDDEFGLARMMEFMDEKDACRVQALRDNLLEILNKVDSVNKNNHTIIEYSLNLNAKFMKMIMNLGQENTIYEYSGKTQNSSGAGKRRLIDRKI